MSDLNAPQPAPTGDGNEVWPSLLADCEVSPRLRELCAERDALGRAKYGTPLRTHNGRDPLVDALQEALDLAVYLHQAAMEGRGWVTQLRALRDEALATAERLLEMRGEP